MKYIKYTNKTGLTCQVEIVKDVQTTIAEMTEDMASTGEYEFIDNGEVEEVEQIKLLEERNKALSAQVEFLEDVIAEMVDKVYV